MNKSEYFQLPKLEREASIIEFVLSWCEKNSKDFRNLTDEEWDECESEWMDSFEPDWLDRIALERNGE